MAQVLVLGGTGMLGHMVLGTLRGAPSLEVDGTQRSDPSDALYLDAEAGSEGLRALLGRSGCDYAVNCVGVTKPNIDERDASSIRSAEAVNGAFPHQLAQAATEVGSRVIHVSTDGVFPEDAGLCYEDTPTEPTDLYGRTKLAGELSDQHALTLRCSIAGPDPMGKRGLLEWFLAQPDGAEVTGFADHRWNGVTTLQLAELCREIIVRERFDAVRAEAAVHHVCPNEPVSKYELLVLFGSAFGRSIGVKPAPGPRPAATRVLGTRYGALDDLYGDDGGLERAIGRLARRTA